MCYKAGRVKTRNFMVDDNFTLNVSKQEKVKDYQRTIGCKILIPNSSVVTGSKKSVT